MDFVCTIGMENEVEDEEKEEGCRWGYPHSRYQKKLKKHQESGAEHQEPGRTIGNDTKAVKSTKHNPSTTQHLVAESRVDAALQREEIGSIQCLIRHKNAMHFTDWAHKSVICMSDHYGPRKRTGDETAITTSKSRPGRPLYQPRLELFLTFQTKQCRAHISFSPR
ncbi:hypothetical protein CC80DRAFT_554346 [Byssothecium circinans]|uniref:Uncharacterized protein n=1 Tax=Byssothecium circinans TaxID=147558 RepID=A0A6A5TC51_9PLEO|nr:hypothetical protein CC80DRAFT_554346 [Byssothecium circinans]